MPDNKDVRQPGMEFPDLHGKTVPADELAWQIFLTHEHPLGDDGPPMVDSAELIEWVTNHAR